MGALVIQTGTRQGRVAELTRVREGSLSIGRSFENDLVLTDLHIAPRQIEIVQDEDNWRLVVLDHTNPVFHNGKKITQQSPVIQSGDRLTIGRTRLSLYSEQHPVEDTRKLVLSNWLSPDTINPILPIVVLFLACLFDFAFSYFEGSTTLNWEALVSGELLAAVLIIIWAGIWSVSGRIVRHQYHFGLQIIATAAVFLFASILGTAVEYVAYPFHSAAVDESVGWIFFFVILALLLHLNLIVATNIQRAALASSVFAGLVSAVVYGFYFFDDPLDVQSVPVYSAELKAPGIGYSPTISLEDYFLDVSRVVANLPDQ
jgi:pSer/pThr/pTyr-binding forkhead associated (FHA) protein